MKKVLLAGVALVCVAPALAADLPSRVADHLHWLGRHAERAENASRLLRTVTARLASEAHQECSVEAALLLNAFAGASQPRADALDPSRPGILWEIHAEIQALVHDGQRTGSVRENIDRLWRTASVVRDRISIDSWKVLSRVRRDSLAGRSPSPPLPGRVADVLPHLDTLIFDLSAFAGLGMESMTRGPGWRFLDMGRRVERAAAAIQVIGGTLAAPRPHAFANGVRPDAQRLEEMLLEIADSSMTYRNRYPGVLEAAPLIDLLVIDETNPRSIGFQFAALAEHVAALQQGRNGACLDRRRGGVLGSVQGTQQRLGQAEIRKRNFTHWKIVLLAAPRAFRARMCRAAFGPFPRAAGTALALGIVSG